MAREDVLVTGLGLVTPAGTNAESTWQGLLAGRSTAATDPEMKGLEVDFSCRVPDFTPEQELPHRLLRRLEPGARFAVIAAREACRDAGLDPLQWDALRVAVVLGVSGNSLHQYEREFSLLADGRTDIVSAMTAPRSFPSAAASEVGIDLGARGPNLVIAANCASGTSALGTARDLLLAGSCDIAFAGAAEAPGLRFSSASLGQLGAISTRADDPAAACRPFDRDRDGFVLGEGAGVLVLERAAHAKARGARAYSRFAGFGASCDAHHYVKPHPEGRGAADAMRTALRDAGLTPEDIDHVNAHGTSTPTGDRSETLALRSVFGAPPAVTATKSVLGHALGGAGGIEAACTVLTLRHQLIPPTANFGTADPGFDIDIVHTAPRPARIRAALSPSYGFGGHNAAVLFTTP